MDLHTTIVGAGPYALSIAAHLRAADQPYHMIGTTMESWRAFMPEGMILKSEPFASNLWDPARRFTFENYCREQGVDYQPIGRPLSLARFLEYAEWFRQSNRIEPENVQLSKLERVSGGFSLELNDGRRMTSRHVVLATGHMAYATVPAEISGLPEPFAVHGSRMAAVSAYQGLDVSIIGAGQAALETAALLHEAGANVRLLVRENHIRWNARSQSRSLLSRMRAPDSGLAPGWEPWAISELPRVFRRVFAPEKRHRYVAGSFGPGGSGWLRDRVDGRIDCALNSRIVHAATQNNRVQLRIETPQGTSELVTDRVIAATGYRVDIDRLDYLPAELKQGIRREAGGIPELSAKFETSIPGLYFVGITSAPIFGPVMRFMFGAKHAAPIVQRALRTR